MDPRATTEQDHIRPATLAERANIRAMHGANRAAWDEAAERYELWLPEAIELIRSGGTNLGFRFSSVATKVNVASVTLFLASSVRLRRQASTRTVTDVLPTFTMLPYRLTSSPIKTG